MAKQNNNQPLPADVAQKDSVGGMAKRLLDPAHVKQLAAWCAQVAKEEGGQALWREISFRVNLALHRDTWQYRADLPTRRMLKRQRAEGVPGGPKISVVVPLYNTPLPFLYLMFESVTGQSY